MPIYKFENTETGEIFDEMMSYDDSVKYLEENPHLKRIIGAPKIVSGVGSQGVKVDNGFREVMSKIKSSHTVNNITKDY